MAYYQDPAVAAMLQGSSRGPVPRRGENRDFDQYCDRMMDNLDAEETDFSEMRKAAWATWGVGPPSRSNTAGPSRQDDEDDELARILALSAQEHHDQQAPGVPLEGHSEDDEELRRAIVMSEEESRAPKRQRREETPEDERRMLAEAMAASMEEHPPARVTNSPETESESEEEGTEPVTAPAVTPMPAALPLVLTGRAQMEQERLERQRARQAAAGKSGNVTAVAANGNTSQPPVSGARHAQVTTMADLNSRSTGESSSSATTSKPRPVVGGPSRTKATAHHPLQSSGPFPSDAAGEYYLDGELRHTALTIGKPTDSPTFSPRQIVGKHSEIALLVMCSFVIDDEWLNQILPPPTEVPTVLIRPHLKQNHQAHNGKVQLQSNGEVWSYPRMMGEWGSAHMKFFWIFYKTGRVRVVISTANMVDYDWEWIENTVFVQDFLPQKPAAPRSSALGDEFVDRFRDLLIHMKVHKAIRHQVESHPFGKRIPLDPSEGLQDLSKLDFSRVRVKLVMSVPGKYTGFDQMNEYGLCRLGNLLKEEKWIPNPGEKIEGEYQGSSLGNYTLEWIDTFYCLMNGKSARDLVGRPKAKEWPLMKVLFPSLDTVRKSELGLEGGGTMFVGQSWKAVTKRLFHDANSKRGGVLMHSKVLIAMFTKQPDTLGMNGDSQESNGKKRKAEQPDKPDIGGWVYVGSHNFTPSAWGHVKLNDKPPTLSINNYELGIVFPLPRDHAREAADAIAPFERPARPYDATDTPWDQKMKGEGKLQMHPPK